MANYEIVEFIAMMQLLILSIYNLKFLLKASGHFNQTKKKKCVTILFLISKLKGIEF